MSTQKRFRKCISWTVQFGFIFNFISAYFKYILLILHLFGNDFVVFIEFFSRTLFETSPDCYLFVILWNICFFVSKSCRDTSTKYFSKGAAKFSYPQDHSYLIDKKLFWHRVLWIKSILLLKEIDGFHWFLYTGVFSFFF